MWKIQVDTENKDNRLSREKISEHIKALSDNTIELQGR